MPREIVYKFPFDTDGVADVNVPADASALHVAEQSGIPCIWVRVDLEAPHVRRRFKMIGTGWQSAIPPHWPHVGSFMMRGGTLVFHVFEETSDAG